MVTPTTRDMIELPGLFSFKVFVRPEQIDREAFLELSRQLLGRDLEDMELRARPSGKGNYICYTLTLRIEVFEEIEQLYKGYREHPAVVYIL